MPGSCLVASRRHEAYLAWRLRGEELDKKAAAGRTRWRPNGGRSVLGNTTVSTTNGSRNEKSQTAAEQKEEENISELGWTFKGAVGFMSTMLLSIR